MTHWPLFRIRSLNTLHNGIRCMSMCMCTGWLSFLEIQKPEVNAYIHNSDQNKWKFATYDKLFNQIEIVLSKLRQYKHWSRSYNATITWIPIMVLWRLPPWHGVEQPPNPNCEWMTNFADSHLHFATFFKSQPMAFRLQVVSVSVLNKQQI